jgi:predicted nucleotidyltransferase
VFGSATTDEFDPERSDVDFLLEFRDDAEASFKTYFALKMAMEQLLGRPVDLVMPKALRNPYFAESVARTSRELYAA